MNEEIEKFNYKIWLIILVLIIFINLSWFQTVITPNCNPDSILSCTTINLHGINLSWIFFSVIALEIIFFFFIFTRKKDIGINWFVYTLKYKFISLLYVLLAYVTIIPFIWDIIFIYKHLDWSKLQSELYYLGVILLVAFGIGLYILLNYLFVKLIAKERKPKFKPGQKVIVRKDLKFLEKYGGLTAYRDMLVLRGKKVTIDKYVDNNFKIKEDKGENKWSEEMIE
jgi:hypothetical protein